MLPSLAIHRTVIFLAVHQASNPTCVNRQLVSSGSWLPDGSHCSMLDVTALHDRRTEVSVRAWGAYKKHPEHVSSMCSCLPGLA